MLNPIEIPTPLALIILAAVGIAAFIATRPGLDWDFPRAKRAVTRHRPADVAARGEEPRDWADAAAGRLTATRQADLEDLADVAPISAPPAPARPFDPLDMTIPLSEVERYLSSLAGDDTRELETVA